MRVHEHFFINGRWIAPRGHGNIDVIQSSNELVIGRIPEGVDADAGAAVAAARAAFERWSLTTPQERGAYLEKIAAGLRERADELADLIAREVGMPLKLANMIQVGSPTATFANYAKMVGEFEWEHTVGHSRVLREPVGVVACITPWNYPLHQIAAKVGA
ncbi:MAG TPA: aldehyde dehydrogenase family protein, partial [Massilia sp.]|nr:aldehyde dehydrogenase family protein [Massilia sp.]